MAKAVTLKNNNNEEIYPVTSADLVTGTIPTSQIRDGAITSNKITNLAVTTNKLADTSVTADKIDYSTMGPVWSSFYFTLPQTSRSVVVTTKKGTQLTLEIGNGGTCIRIIAGGENVKLLKQYWRATYSAALSDNYGLHGCASGANITCRYTSWLSNGSSSNGGVIVNTASTGTSGDCYGSLASITNSHITTMSQATHFGLGNNGWAVVG